MHLNAHPINLKLTTPFRISHGVQETSPNVIVEIIHNDVKGYGEASPTEYYGESPASVLACMELFKNDVGDDPFALEDIMERLNHTIGLNPAAKAAIDMALYDLMGKMLGVPLYKLLGLNAAKTPYTSFTIGIDSPAQMAKKAALAKDYPILKVKLGTKHDIEIIKAIREVSNATSGQSLCNHKMCIPFINPDSVFQSPRSGQRLCNYRLRCSALAQYHQFQSPRSGQRLCNNHAIAIDGVVGNISVPSFGATPLQ